LSSVQISLANQYFGGLAHVHTKLSNHPGHNESDLVLPVLVSMLETAGLCANQGGPIEYIMINEHSSNPDRPKQLGKFSLRTNQLLRQRKRTIVQSMPVLFGLEVSLLADGGTDMTEQLAEHCALVIASRHRLPSESEHDEAVIMAMLKQACKDPTIDVLGHPMRNIEGVKEINWKQIFALAASTGTAIEVNWNVFFKEASDPRSMSFWEGWLKLLGQSRVKVFIGVDLHNRSQVQTLTSQWRQLEHEVEVTNELWRFVNALTEADIEPERVVTANFKRLQEWLHIDKAAPSQVLLP
jgi:histidinol phosphatase-like PHP family hydrolase